MHLGQQSNSLVEVVTTMRGNKPLLVNYSFGEIESRIQELFKETGKKRLLTMREESRCEAY